MAFWCDIAYRETFGLAENLGHAFFVTFRHPFNGWRFDFHVGRFPVSTAFSCHHKSSQRLPFGSRIGLNPTNQNANHTSLLRPLALARFADCALALTP